MIDSTKHETFSDTLMTPIIVFADTPSGDIRRGLLKPLYHTLTSAQITFSHQWRFADLALSDSELWRPSATDNLQT